MASDMEAGEPEGGSKGLDESDLNQGGSARRARQNASADLPAEQLIIATAPPPGMPQDLPPSNATNTPRYFPEASLRAPAPPIRSTIRPQMPTIVIPGLGPVSASQWTQLRGNSFWQQDSRYQIPQQTVGRAPPPARPSRPRSIPSLHSNRPEDNHRALQHQGEASAQDGQLKYDDGRFAKPPGDDSRRIADGSSSSATESHPSTIPAFPLPTALQTLSPPTRRIANLGPPPSARKGASMYYSQNSYVTSIPEEMPEGYDAYGSGHVIPTNGSSNPPINYMGDGREQGSGINASSVPARGQESSWIGDPQGGARIIDPSRRSKASPKEAIGIQRFDSPAGPSPISAAHSDTSNSRWWNTGLASEAVSPIDQQTKNEQDPEAPRQLFLAAPSGMSPASTDSTSPVIDTPLSPYSGSQTPADPRIKNILGNLAKGTAFGTIATASPPSSTAPSTGEQEQKPPSRLHRTGSERGEVRTSQSSLPELIRRAAKLASNLDRNRSRSRSDAWDEFSQNEKSAHSNDTNTISDILAAFPSPSSSPPGERRTPRRTSPVGKSSLSNQSSKVGADPHKHRGRRCCGMPAWAFALLCLVLLLLVAAAVIIPVTLIVLPKQRENEVPTLASCIQKSPCSNGGINVLIENSCRCVCTNGLTGTACTTLSEQGCTTSDFKDGQSGTIYRNATTGSGIPRILLNADRNFSIPLNATSLLSLFSSTNLSCADQNQLITFSGQERRRSLPRQSAMPKLVSSNERAEVEPSVRPPHTTQAPFLAPALLARDEALPSPVENDFFRDDDTGIITSNEIILAGPTNVFVPNLPSTTIASGNSVPTSAVAPVPQRAIDFARVAVLFIFQETSLSEAVVARDRLSETLKNAQTYDLSPVQAGSSIEVDFGKLMLVLGNGTVLGGKDEDI